MEHVFMFSAAGKYSRVEAFGAEFEWPTKQKGVELLT